MYHRCVPWSCRSYGHLSSTSRYHGHGCKYFSNSSQKTHVSGTRNQEDFWAEAALNITWFKKFDRVLDTSKYPWAKWFSGGELNTCYNALDRHVDAGLGNQPALIYDSPVTNVKKEFTFQQMQTQVSQLARQLVCMGVGVGDRVLIYLPMIPQAVMSMLACARIGAPHSVVFGGFAAKELATRIGHVQPKVIISANCGVEPSRTVWYKPILDDAIALANLPDKVSCLIYNREGFSRASLNTARDIDWNDCLNKGSLGGHDCIPVSSHHPLYILYTSGTTGMPKGVVRSTGGHTVILPWTLKWVYGMNPGETWWAASDLGWVVGHSYICYAPLLAGLTSILYEGKPVGTPDAAQFYRVIAEHKVSGMFCAPTALRAIKRDDPENLQSQGYSRKTLRYLFVAGEHCDSETRLWAQKSFQVPVLDNWWQTETGHPIAASGVRLGCSLNPPLHSSGVAVPGFQLEVLKEDGSPAAANELGRIVAKLPMPPGFMDTLYKADDLFVSAYFTRFPGYYDTMDAGYLDEAGNVFVMARDDDVINVAGHRIDTSALEEAVLEHEDVSEAAVVGVPDPMKGQVPLALYVKKPKSQKSEDEINEELVKIVRKNVGPVACFKLAFCVKALPRTRSGKTPRKSLADLAMDKTVQVPPTIEDASVYQVILEVLQKNGFGQTAKLKY